MNPAEKRLLAWLSHLGGRFYLAAAVLALAGGLVVTGIVFARSTGSSMVDYPGPQDIKHLLRVFMGLAMGVLACLPHWRRFERWAAWFYGLAVLGLVAVLLVGPTINATRRWLDIGGMRFQVSEAAKIALVLLLARYLKATREKQSVRTSLWTLLLTLLPMLLIIREPDLGTSLLFPPVLFAMLLCAGGKPSHIMTIVMIGFLLAPIVYVFGLAHYQKNRIRCFISPTIAAELDQDSVLQINQSMESIGTGGFMGKGLGRGNPDLPVRESDFIFSVIAEELGFVGAAGLMLMYMLFFYFCLEIGAGTYDLFGRLTCVGLTVFMFVQTVINMAMTMGLMPITGMNLPLVSRGGSSLMTTSVCVGLMLNIALRPTRTLARPFRTLH